MFRANLAVSGVCRGLAQTIAYALLVSLTTACWSARGVAPRPSTNVAVATYDPAGRPTSGSTLARQVWGIKGEAGEPIDPVPWEALDLGDGPRASSPGGEVAQEAADTSGSDTTVQALVEASGNIVQDPPPAAGEDVDAVQDPVPLPQIDAQERNRREALMRTQFGEAILIGKDGRLTKQFFLSSEAGYVFESLLSPLAVAGSKRDQAVVGGTFGGPEHSDSVLGRLLGDAVVEVMYIKDFEQIQQIPIANTNEIRNRVPKLTESGKNSLLLVTARPTALRAFERALDVFYANIPQIEISVTVLEFSVTDSLNFGATPFDDNTPTLRSQSSGTLIQEITSSFPLSAPFLGASSINDSGLLRLSAIQNGWELNALIQALETNQQADIRSEPHLIVRNGGVATISTTTDQPFPKAQISNQSTVSSSVEFKPVGVILNIRPEIAGTDTVILQIHASVSAVTGFAGTEPIPTPVIATREATTSVHLRKGQGTVIGGLISESTLDSESKLPILGDIPILGALFRSTTSQVQRTEVKFFIQPRIVTGASQGFVNEFGGNR